MKFKLKSYILPLLLVVTFIFSTVIPEDAFARRGGFGGGRSFRSSRSSSWGKSTKQKAWGSSKAGKMSSQRGMARNPKSRPQSRADRALYEKAKTNGTVFKNRADAGKSFASKHGSQYGSKYATKPATRPDHIPETTMVKGKPTPVSYNPSYGGYGYYGPGGKWIIYSAMADMAMMSMLMNRHHYYYGAAPMRYGGSGGSMWSGVFIVFIIIFLAIMFKNRF